MKLINLPQKVTKIKKKKQEENPGAEEVTISLEQYFFMNKGFQELGGTDPSVQSRKREESLGVVQETPQYHNQNHLKMQKLGLEEIIQFFFAFARKRAN